MVNPNNQVPPRNNQGPPPAHIPTWIIPAGFIIGAVLLVTVLILAVVHPNATEQEFTVFRIVLSLGGAAFSMAIVGFLEVKFNLPGGGIITAGSSLAVFVILFFFSPKVFSPPPPPPPRRFSQAVHVERNDNQRSIPKAVVVLNVGEYGSNLSTDALGSGLFRDIDGAYLDNQTVKGHFRVELDNFRVATREAVLTGLDPIPISLTPIPPSSTGLGMLEQRPSRIVTTVGSDEDLLAAAKCLKDYQACVNDSVARILSRTQGAPEQIELRTQALAIRANQTIQNDDPSQLGSAERDYEEALSEHAENNDGHKERWRLELAGAYAFDSRYHYDNHDPVGGAVLTDKGWNMAQQVASLAAKLGARADYSAYPNFPWATAVKRGNVSGEREEVAGHAGLRLQCDNGQFTVIRVFGLLNIHERHLLSWDWQGRKTPSLGDARTLNKVDEALQILVVLETRQIIHYLWDANAPVGFTLARPDGNDKSLELLLLVLKSGDNEFGVPVPEHVERDILADYHKFYPNVPEDKVPNIVAIGLQTRCEDTHAKGDGWISPLTLSTPSEPAQR